MWEPETFKALYQEVDADVTYLGVGEWCGVTGLFAAQRAKRTVLVEPDPLALAELRSNVHLYNAELHGAHAPRIAIESRCSLRPLAHPPAHSAHACIHRTCRKRRKKKKKTIPKYAGSATRYVSQQSSKFGLLARAFYQVREQPAGEGEDEGQRF